MIAALRLALGDWQRVAVGAVLLGFAVYIVMLKADARHWQKLADNRAAQLVQLQADVHARTAEAKAADAAHARDVERAQVTATTEVSREYQARLAALRARYDGLLTAAQADPGRGGSSAVPALPGAAVGPDGAASAGGLLAPADAWVSPAFSCEANSLQLLSLQQWVREQQSLADVP